MNDYLRRELGYESDLAYEILTGRVEMAFYEAGHMMYIREASLVQFTADLAAFLGRALGGPAR